MKKKNSKFLIIFLLLFISIGFAYLSANLDIMGIANVRKMKWNIYFDNIKNYEHEECFNEKPTTTGTTTTSLNFKVSLEDPGDSCSFNIDVINDGSIDAMVSLLQKTNLDDAQSKLLDFNTTYADGSPIENKNFLGSGESETLKISLTFNRNIEIEDLPTADTEINVTIDLQYQQAKDSDKRQNSNTAIIKDLSGNANHGKIVGATINDDGTVSTSGKGDFINCGSDFDVTNAMSIVVRFKLDKHYNRENPIIGNWNGSGYGIAIMQNHDLVASYYINGGSDYAFFYTDTIIEENQWHTVVSVYDGSKIKLYLDGEAQKLKDSDSYEKEAVGEIKNSSISTYIGANPASDEKNESSNKKTDTCGAYTFESVLMFNRALDESEIVSNYSNVVTPLNKDGLMLYYQLKN